MRSESHDFYLDFVISCEKFYFPFLLDIITNIVINECDFLHRLVFIRHA